MPAKDAETAAKFKLISTLLVALAIALLGAVALFLVRSYQSAKPVDAIVTTLLLAGVGALIAAELLPIVQSIKVGSDGFSLEFRNLGEDLTNEIGALNARIARLELDATSKTAPAPVTGTSAAVAMAATPKLSVSQTASTPPELDLPGPYRDDPRKGQFGGEAARDGYVLDAIFPGRRDRAWAQIVITVTSAPDAKGPPPRSAEFFLHNSFDEPRVVVPFVAGVATLKLTAWGGFTVGVWIADPQVKLELDLALMSTAPPVVRDR